MDEFQNLLAIPNPLTRVQMASVAMDEHRRAMSRLATIRAQALLELRQQGNSAAEIARMLGISRQQVHRLLREAIGGDYHPEAYED